MGSARAAVAALTEIEKIEQLLVEARSRLLLASGPVRPDLAGQLYQVRRARERVFGDASVAFGEPAWDMLLELYQAGVEGRRVAVSSACAASGAPTTSALRHVERLERLGLVERTRDTVDRRRSFIQSTDRANVMMGEWLGRTVRLLGLDVDPRVVRALG